MKRAAPQKVSKTQKKRKTTIVHVNQQPVVIGRPNAKFQPEMKSVDTILVGQGIASGTGAASHNALLNGLILGPDRYNRIGRRIQIKSIHVNVNLHPVTPVPTSVPETIIFALVVDIDAPALPALGDIFQNTDNTGTSFTGVTAHRNLNTSKRFKILKKKIVPLRICGTATGALPCNGSAFQATQDDLNWDWHVKTDILTQYNNGNAGTLNDIENGALLFCWWTDLGPALPTSSFDLSARIRYFD